MNSPICCAQNNSRQRRESPCRSVQISLIEAQHLSNTHLMHVGSAYQQSKPMIEKTISNQNTE